MKSTRFQSEERFFHFASRISHQSWNQKPISQRWELLLQGLKIIQHREDVQWIAGVLMRTHFHLLFSTRTIKENILMIELEKWLSEQLQVPGEAFEHPILCEQIRSLEQFRQTYKYIYRNPVEASLCKQVQDYPWSSLNEILHPKHTIVFADKNALVQNPLKTLIWLNKKTNKSRPESSFLN